MWRELTPDLLLSRLAEAEYEALANAAAGRDNLLEEIAADVAAEWRAALSRVVRLDKRPRAVPDAVMTHALADYRYRAFTRLPGMGSLNDDDRKEEWRRANHVRDNLKPLAIEPPDDGATAEGGGRPGPRFKKNPRILD